MTNSYGWLITHDGIPDTDYPEGTNCNAKGVVGPRDIDPAIAARLHEAAKRRVTREAAARKFKMYDDDEELYYTGLYIGPDDENMFGPLEDFGTPNAGCTEIRYLNPETGEYETL